MACALRELARKSSTLRTIARFNITQHSNLVAPPLFPHQPIFTEFILDYPSERSPFLGSSLITNKIGLWQPSPIYPSFPFGYCLNPITPTGSDLLEEAEEVNGSGEDPIVWADSVKKKRKRKMNKHKYKKLRKRLRRKT